MMTRVDWKRDGFAAGSRTDALDWKDWKRLLISRPNAKLLRKRTYWISEEALSLDNADLLDWKLPC